MWPWARIEEVRIGNLQIRKYEVDLTHIEGQAQYIRVPYADFNALILPPGKEHEADFVLLAGKSAIRPNPQSQRDHSS